MKARSGILFYILTIGGLAALIFFVLEKGSLLQTSAADTLTVIKPAGEAASVFQHPLAVFILQITVIVIAARISGYLFKKMGQPAVMGEIIAGILLGPSLLGNIAPEASSFLFPKTSLGNLQMLSQVGLILFMFVIGMELDLDVLKKKAGAAIVISHASIVFPYGLGVSLAYFLYSTYATPNTPFYSFALFMGIAMSITAFPVLARIIRERGLSNTKLGTMAITCAAADDITAWCLLAIVIAVAKAGSFAASLTTLLYTVTYAAVMVFAIRPMLKKLLVPKGNAPMQRSSLAIAFIVMLLSAYCCEIIGIHALFGAFIAGVVMPADMHFRNGLIHRIEDVALVLLLPLFFVFTGLRTQVGLLNDASLWLTCLLIIAVAVLGKLGGSTLAARFTGESWKDSFAIGALMNTRGLVELVVLNVGYDLGILSPQIFTMLVLMAIITTMMTGPLLNIIAKTKD
ncbi:cation:proton antiporter domain-containing protein [Chitinophagaceae bacterium MMS25-I14]